MCAIHVSKVTFFTTFGEVKSLADIKEEFENSLSEIYPKREVESIFLLAVEHVLGWSRLKMGAEINTLLNKSQIIDFKFIKDLLIKSVPIQYAIGSTEFYGLEFSVNEHVLIPRQETEELVRWVLNTIQQTRLAEPKIVDIGTGSGCIPISIDKNLNNAKVFGLDVSINALEVANKNNKINDTKVHFYELDVLQDDLSNYSDIDVIVSNPPYVLPSEKQLMHSNVLNHEPHLALFVEENDPLVFYKRIAQLALESLKKRGFLFFEINERYGQETLNLLVSVGYEEIIVKKDINGKDRMIRCTKP